MEIRHRIYGSCNLESPLITLGDVELDENYFDAKRVRRKRGRGAYGKPSICTGKDTSLSSIIEMITSML